MKYLIITTINPITKAIEKFIKTLDNDRKIVIVWDRKGPFEYPTFDGKIDFLDIETQYKLYPEFAKSLPEGHYWRKNIWYIHAIKEWAEFIAETDDDNIPYDFFPNFLDNKDIETEIIINEKVVNIYKKFTKENIRPRGLPLDRIQETTGKKTIIKNIKPRIQQGLADDDPDVDAIYRLTQNKKIKFDKDKIIWLDKNIYSPFNTQNTYRHKEAFPLLYIPTSVKSRICDIWKGYIAQKWLRSLWGTLVFLSPSVYQERNSHNLLSDFEEELPLYLKSKLLIEKLEEINLWKNMFENIMTIYKELILAEFIDKKELKPLEEWIKLF